MANSCGVLETCKQTKQNLEKAKQDKEHARQVVEGVCYHTEVDKLKLKLDWLSLEIMVFSFK